MFHFGSLSLTGEPARTATRRAVEYAKKQGKLISYDPNLRKPLWPDLEEAREQLLWGLSQADVVKISDEEVTSSSALPRKKGPIAFLNDSAQSWCSSPAAAMGACTKTPTPRAVLPH